MLVITLGQQDPPPEIYLVHHGFWGGGMDAWCFYLGAPSSPSPTKSAAKPEQLTLPPSLHFFAVSINVQHSTVNQTRKLSSVFERFISFAPHHRIVKLKQAYKVI